MLLIYPLNIYVKYSYLLVKEKILMIQFLSLFSKPTSMIYDWFIMVYPLSSSPSLEMINFQAWMRKNMSHPEIGVAAPEEIRVPSGNFLQFAVEHGRLHGVFRSCLFLSQRVTEADLKPRNVWKSALTVKRDDATMV